MALTASVMETLLKSHWLLCRPQSPNVPLVWRGLSFGLDLAEVGLHADDGDGSAGDDLDGEQLPAEAVDARELAVLEVLERPMECNLCDMWVCSFSLSFMERAGDG
ncbi:Hypothetical predicted protein [Lecanosticta acicola]|uniref:Uncharacterized protein n=1 Tax=Lecanosticta acicola TaxID=111012 RepID=A0AAI9EBQ8_9PEZI|nr:Hypothetical predicted protein [Lecanosticta acicola]